VVVVVVDTESITATEDADVAVTTAVTTTGVDTEEVGVLDVATDEAVVLAADTVLAVTTVVDELANDC